MHDIEAITIGLGGNQPSGQGLSPCQTQLAALERLQAAGLRIIARSRFWRTQPIPLSDQPWFTNAVVRVTSDRSPEQLLALLHEVENDFGRMRSIVNAARPLDLDLLTYGQQQRQEPGGLMLPHPRLHERAFVLLPLLEVAPDWRHPSDGRRIAEMLHRMPAGQVVESGDGTA